MTFSAHDDSVLFFEDLSDKLTLRAPTGRRRYRGLIMQFSSRRTFTARHRILLTSTALLAIGAASEAAAQDIGVAPPEPVHALRLTEPAETLSGETEGLVLSLIHI